MEIRKVKVSRAVIHNLIVNSDKFKNIPAKNDNIQEHIPLISSIFILKMGKTKNNIKMCH